MSGRVLLATIRSLARCPCPRCYVEKSKIEHLGTKADMNARKHERVDNHPRRSEVDRTRSWIYERGYGINSVRIDRVLGSKSYVPTRVSILFSTMLLYNVYGIHVMLLQPRTHFPHDLPYLVSTSSKCLCRIFYMSLNSGCGRRYSHTSSASCMPLEVMSSRSSIVGE